jgi:hypothetical protein
LFAVLRLVLHLAAAGLRCYTAAMPTKHPRIFLTMSAGTLAKLDRLAAKWRMSRPEALRKALKEAAKREGV